MTDSIISNAIKTSIDRPKYEGFDACADITFELLNGEKNKLIEKISSGSYLTSEEQYFLLLILKYLSINRKNCTPFSIIVKKCILS